MNTTRPNPRFQYSEMTETQARCYLTSEFGVEEVDKWNDRNNIISYVDVLYYADAYGDLEGAILLQAFDKSLPVQAHKGLLESGRDIFEAVNCHDLETMECPCCGAEMWHFEIREGGGYTSHNWIDEYGNLLDHETFVDNIEDHYWNADPGENDAPVLCGSCSYDIGRKFPIRKTDPGSVVVHFGETDEISMFSVSGNLVRSDFEAHYNMTDLWGLPGGYEDGLPKALAASSLVEWLNENGWTEISQKKAVETNTSVKSRHYQERKYRRVANEWAGGSETHPDLDFTYVIDFSTFGHPSFFVAEENESALLAEIVTAM